MGRKLALVIGNTDYSDPRFSNLSTPAEDVHSLADLLKDPSVGGFDDLEPLINEEQSVVSRTVEKFFSGKMRDDLLLFYFSGHGMLDEDGQLYFAVKDTDFEAPRSSSLPAEFVRGAMDRTRSQRVVLILDCCHSGAFARGQKAAIGGSVGTKSVFAPENGYGRWVLTATDATQYAWEGNQLVGPETTSPRNSVFTRYLVQGLREGAADLDHDGLVSVRDLSDYVYDQVARQKLKQTPSLWTYKEQGNLFIANNPRPMLPAELRDAMQSPYPNVRLEAVQQLARLAASTHPGLVLQAVAGLQGLTGDDSRKVARAAAEALKTVTVSDATTDRVLKSSASAKTEPVADVHDMQSDSEITVTETTTTGGDHLDLDHNLSTRDSFKKAVLELCEEAAHTLLSLQTKAAGFLAHCSQAAKRHRKMVIRVEISLAALVVAMGTWHFTPKHYSEVATTTTPVPVQTTSTVKPAESSPPQSAAENPTPSPAETSPSAQPPAAAPVTSPPTEPIMVSELVMKNYLIERIQPVYPLAARQAHIQGKVVLQALIDQEGFVKKINTINGKPLLATAASQALQSWRYRPYPNRENPISVATVITFNFHLKPAPAAPQTRPQPAVHAPAQPSNPVSLATNTAPSLDGSLPATAKIYSRKDGVSEPELTYRLDPPYTKQASKARLEGEVVLQIVVTADGTVGNVQVLRGLGMGLDESAESTVKTWRFKPGLKDGKPVAVRVNVTINFILRG